MLCEKKLQRVKFLRNTLDVVQTVNTNNDFHAPKTLLQLRYAIFYRLFLQILFWNEISINGEGRRE